jgi:hypothetical protein
MPRICLFLVASLLLLSATVPPQPVLPIENQQTIQPGSNEWTPFRFLDGNTKAQPQFFVYLAQPAYLQLTDLHCTGDRFEVFDNDECLGRTSQVAFDGCETSTADPNVAFYDRRWSRGEWRLAPGGHVIQVRVDESPMLSGAAALRVIY